MFSRRVSFSISIQLRLTILGLHILFQYFLLMNKDCIQKTLQFPERKQINKMLFCVDTDLHNYNTRSIELFKWTINKRYIHTSITLYINQIRTNSNITSFFRFVNKRASYPFGIISLAHVPVNVTDFSIGSINCVRLFPQA
jgi:hypothetical protein